MVRLIIFALLVLGSSPLAFTQNAPIADTTAARLKGAIWTATALRVWTDLPLPGPLPQPWQTDTEFKNWLKQQPQPDNSGLTGLKDHVVKRIKDKFKKAEATPQQLAEAIVAEVFHEAKSSKSVLHKVQVGVLDKELRALLNGPTTPAASVAQPTTSPVAGANNPIGPSPETKTITVENGTAASDAGLVSNTSKSAVPARASYVSTHPMLFIVLGVMLGLGLGAFAMQRYLRNQQPQQPYVVQPPAVEPPIRARSKSQSSFSHRQQEVNAGLGVKAPVKQREDSSAQKAHIQADPAAEPPIVEPSLTSAQEVEPPVAAAVPPAVPAVCYAPAQEGGYIEERKVVADALPQLPIMLRPDAKNPDRATFTLNPHVNQGKLIGDGLEQLRDYFDFTLPAGKIVAVTAAGSGQLQRAGDGWQVATLAKLSVR